MHLFPLTSIHRQEAARGQGAPKVLSACFHLAVIKLDTPKFLQDFKDILETIGKILASILRLVLAPIMKMEEQRYRLQFQHFADTTSYSVPKQLTNVSFCTVLHA